MQLTRQPIPDLAGLNEELAVKAESLLGYSAMREHLGIPGPLALVLKSLGMEPFNADAVMQYKIEQRDKANEGLPHGQSTTEWKRHEIGKYRGLIPMHVIDRAISIVSREPRARFFIDELGDDPFLIVSLGAESYVIDQWDEDFE